jgi:hypothetical protein
MSSLTSRLPAATLVVALFSGRLAAFRDCSPPWSSWALRRSFQCSDFPRILLSYRPLHAGLTFPAPRRPRAFSAPRRFIPHWPLRPSFMSVSPLGFRYAFEGFSPLVAPGASRLAVSSLSLSSGRPCGRRRRSASRISASNGCVDAAPWVYDGSVLAPSLVVFPFEVSASRPRSALPRCSSLGLL